MISAQLMTLQADISPRKYLLHIRPVKCICYYGSTSNKVANIVEALTRLLAIHSGEIASTYRWRYLNGAGQLIWLMRNVAKYSQRAIPEFGIHLNIRGAHSSGVHLSTRV
jgi:hypothetical protein